jgi:hypothetical protein
MLSIGIKKTIKQHTADMDITDEVIHERGTSEFLFCRNQQYQWQ